MIIFSELEIKDPIESSSFVSYLDLNHETQ